MFLYQFSNKYDLRKNEGLNWARVHNQLSKTQEYCIHKFCPRNASYSDILFG